MIFKLLTNWNIMRLATNERSLRPPRRNAPKLGMTSTKLHKRSTRDRLCDGDGRGRMHKKMLKDLGTMWFAMEPAAFEAQAALDG